MPLLERLNSLWFIGRIVIVLTMSRYGFMEITSFVYAENHFFCLFIIHKFFENFDSILIPHTFYTYDKDVRSIINRLKKAKVVFSGQPGNIFKQLPWSTHQLIKRQMKTMLKKLLFCRVFMTQALTPEYFSKKLSR